MDSEILFFVTPCIQEAFFLLLSIGSISVHSVPTFALFNEIVKILHITFSPDTKKYISVQNHNFKIFKTLVSLHPYRVLLVFRRFLILSSSRPTVRLHQRQLVTDVGGFQTSDPR